MSQAAGATHPFTVFEPLEGRALLSGYSIATLDPLLFGAGEAQTAVSNGINKQGAVAGSISRSQYDPPRAALRDAGGKIRELGTLSNWRSSAAAAVNDLGDAVGDAQIVSGPSRSFLYHAGKLSMLPGVGDGASRATSINNAGTVVGSYAARGSYYSYPVMWSGGQMKRLGTGAGIALDVNNKNQVVGDASFPNVPAQAFLYQNGQVKPLGILPGGTNSRAYAINDAGQIAGASFTGGFGVHAVLWSGGKMRDIGVLPGDLTCIAQDINGTGTIVGQSHGATTGDRAVVWKPGANGPSDLNSFFPGAKFRLYKAVGVNDAGQIVAMGVETANKSRWHLYLLTPKPDAPVAAAAPRTSASTSTARTATAPSLLRPATSLFN